MIGKTISHYRILATKVIPLGKKPGEGGMGVVYKVHETKLNRDFAKKFFPPEPTPNFEYKECFVCEFDGNYGFLNL